MRCVPRRPVVGTSETFNLSVSLSARVWEMTHDIVAEGIFIARDRLVSEVVGRPVNAKHWNAQAAMSRANCSFPDLSPLKIKGCQGWKKTRG